MGWVNGFGANSYAEKYPNKYISDSAGIHPGMDFGKQYKDNCVSCNYVYSTVSGTVTIKFFAGDADPNVVIDVGNGLYVIYGHVIGSLVDGAIVKPGDVIGSLQDQREYNLDKSLKLDNTHVHLVVRKDQRIYNPAYFFQNPQVLSKFSWGYAAGENLYSISSYVYGSSLDFWNNPLGLDLTRN